MPEIRDRFVAAMEARGAVVANRWMLWVLSDPGSPLARWRESSWMKCVAELYRHRLNGDEPAPEKWEASSGASWAVVRKYEQSAEAHTGLDRKAEAKVVAARATAWAASPRDAYWVAVSAARASLLARMDDDTDPADHSLRIARPATDREAWKRMLDELYFFAGDPFAEAASA